MQRPIYTFFIIVVLLVSISGCYIKPVRHLASDIALLTAGKSTQEDVLIFLGEPDDKQKLEDGVEKWLYTEEKATFLEKTPYVGKHIGSPEYRRAVVTLKDGVVSDASYFSKDEDDMDWADDYSWQGKKK